MLAVEFAGEIGTAMAAALDATMPKSAHIATVGILMMSLLRVTMENDF